jgi:hypothetical protein
MLQKDTRPNKYNLRFTSISDEGASIQVIDHCKNKTSIVRISLNESELNLRNQSIFPDRIADLIDLAVAIHASDRLVAQNPRNAQVWIEVTLPVRNPNSMNRDSFREKLSDLLEWVTGSRWIFHFETRLETRRITEQQTVLPIIHVTEVALWSGGLDALAGLYHRLKDDPSASFMLLGSGGNDNVYFRQERLFQRISPLFPNRVHLCRVPIRFSDSKQHQKNKISRARGVVFTLIGFSCAYLMGQRSLKLYENGIGAINLPYRKSSVGLDHSRSVHPLTLLKVSDVISEFLGETGEVSNPFLFWTKAEMCKELAKDGQDDLVSSTKSCDSPHRQHPMQCGYCSSCILRRQAILASGLTDNTQYVVSHGERKTKNIDSHLKSMLDQISTLKSHLESTNSPDIKWQKLTRRFTELDDVTDGLEIIDDLPSAKIREDLMRLYQAYVSEWDSIGQHIQSDLLR